MNKYVKKRNHPILLALALAALLAALTLGMGIPCPFYTLTGLKCPACGSTRAVRALLQGDLTGAFYQNRMLLPELVTGGGLILYARHVSRAGGPRQKKLLAAACILFCGLLILWMIVRNFYHI